MRAELFALSDITHIPASEQAFNMFTVLMNRFMWTLMLCHKTFQSRRQILANITHLPCVRCSVESFTYIISFNLYNMKITLQMNFKGKFHVLVGMNSESESKSHSVASNSLQPHGLYSPWNSPGKPKNTGVGRLSFLQGIFLTQGLNPVSHIAGRHFTI